MKISKESFGHFTEYVLSNPKTGESVSLLPEFGGIIRKMLLQKAENVYNIIACAKSNEQLINEMAAYPSAHLFPWGNRVRDGKYSFEGSDFQLSINEVPLNNAIHGFVAFANFEVIEEKVDENYASLVLRYDYKANYLGFPFPFVLEITNTLSAECGFTLTYSVKNTGKLTMPFVLGWHPYFKIEGEMVNDWTINFPATKQSIPDKQMISVDSTSVDFSGGIALATQNLDAVFSVESDKKIVTVLHSIHKALSVNVWQEALEKQFNFTVVYIPTSRDCVAIEPMTGNTNAYNSGDGLLTLAAGEIYKVSCGVFLS